MIDFDKYQIAFLEAELQIPSVSIINALPGSGKSTILSEKCNRLVFNENIDPSKISAVTFSNRAARDLNNKMKYGNKATTIHSMMISLLRRSGVKVNIINDWGRSLILREMVDKLKFQYDNKRELNEICFKIIEMIGYYTVNHSLTEPIDTFKIGRFMQNTILNNDQFVGVYKWFDEFKKNKDIWDYDDVISERAINKINTDLVADIQYSFWDEAQDQDLLMYNIIDKLFKHTAIILIGDVFQRIYSFRYAYSFPMEQPEIYFPNKHIYKFELKKNYRSTANIVKCFNVCRQFYDKLEAESSRESVINSVKILTVDTNIDEGRIIAEYVSKFVDEGHKLRDISVLVRKSSYIKSVLEPAFINANIDYNVVTPQYRKRIYDLDLNRVVLSVISACIYNDISYLYYVVDLLDGIGKRYKEVLIEQFVKNEINTGDKKYKIIQQFFNEVTVQYSEIKSISAFFNLIEQLIFKYASGVYTQKHMNLANKIFKNYALLVFEADQTKSLNEIMETIINDISAFDSSMNEGVVLSTIFQYKGLEQKIVFLADNTFVGSQNSEDESQICYVGLSRAKDKLIVVDSQYNIDRKLRRSKSNLLPTWKKTKNALYQIATNRS